MGEPPHLQQKAVRDSSCALERNLGNVHSRDSERCVAERVVLL